MRIITAESSSHQSLFAELLLIHSRLSTLVSDANLLFPLTCVNHVKSSTECTVISALAANSLSDGDTSDSNMMVACLFGHEGCDSARSEVQLQYITCLGYYFPAPGVANCRSPDWLLAAKSVFGVDGLDATLQP